MLKKNSITGNINLLCHLWDAEGVRLGTQSKVVTLRKNTFVLVVCFGVAS